MGLFCLDRLTLAGSVDLDRALQDKASDLGPPLFDISLGCEVPGYMHVVIYFLL